jgi:Ca2+-binding RTX toxin-like protein
MARRRLARPVGEKGEGIHKRGIARATVLVSALTVLVALWAPAARADTAVCTYNAGAHAATIDVTKTASPAAQISIRSTDGALFVYAGGVSGPCGAATRNNTDTITVNTLNAAPTGGLVYILPGVPFAPGFTNEPGSSDEIEMTLNLTGGGRWILGISASGSTVPLDIALGGTSLNLNASEADGWDADATVSGASYAFVMGSTVADRITADGAPGVATPWSLPLITSSGPGADLLSGGAMADDLSGGLGNDVIHGRKGKDDLKGEDGVDRLFGEAGADKLLGGPAKDRLNGGKGTDSCTIKHDKHKSCEVATGDKKA